MSDDRNDWRRALRNAEQREYADEGPPATMGTPVVCGNCGSGHVKSGLAVETFDYAVSPEQTVRLKAPVRVHTCQDCGEEFTDSSAEIARHEAVCDYLGRLTPTKLRELRRVHVRSRREFAQDTGLGEASIGRWESGAQIQTASVDAYLRLLFDKANYEATRRLLNPGAAEVVATAQTVVRRSVIRGRTGSFDIEAARRRAVGFQLCVRAC